MQVHPKVRYWLLDPFWGGLDYLAHYGLERLPTEWASAIGGFLGRLARGRFAAADKRAAANLRVLRPEVDENERARLLTEMWEQMGRTLCELAINGRLWDEGRIEVTDPAQVAGWCIQQRPMVFMFTHLGNWEVSAVAAVRLGIALRTVAVFSRNRFHNRLLRQSRARFGFEPVSADYAGIRAAYQHLEQKGAIGFAIDEYRKRQPVLPRFGRTTTPTGNVQHALRMAKKFQAILIVGRCERLPGVRFRVTATALVDQNLDWYELPQESQIEQINALIEPWFHQHPEQWYWLDQVNLQRTGHS